MDRGLWFYFLFPNIHPRFPGKDASAQTFYESMTIRISKDLEKFLRFEKHSPLIMCVLGARLVSYTTSLACSQSGIDQITALTGHNR